MHDFGHKKSVKLQAVFDLYFPRFISSPLLQYLYLHLGIIHLFTYLAENQVE